MKNAVKYVVISSKMYEELFGLKHFETIQSYYAVSELYVLAGEYKKAIKYYRKNFDYIENNTSVKDSERVEAYMDIADLFIHAKDNTNDIKYYKKALDIYGVDYKWLEIRDKI